MSATPHNVEDVTFRIYDFSTLPDEMAEQGMKPGFYYDVPLETDEQVAEGEIFLAGPYATAERARDAAVEFIKEAIAEQKDAA